MSELPERIQMKISPEPNSGCWLWDASWDVEGYGKAKHNRRSWLAHRIVYQFLVGRIPDGLELDHLCRVHCCVNPDHLEPVTRLENMMRGIGPAVTRARILAKTHCPQGHPYTGGNLYINPKGRRECRVCRRAAGRRYREKIF